MGLQSCRTARKQTRKQRTFISGRTPRGQRSAIPLGTADLCRRACTHVDDGVRLDVVHVRVAQAQLLASSLGGAHDAGGDGVLQREGAADGHHKLARSQVCRAAEQQHRQLHLRKQPRALEPPPFALGDRCQARAGWSPNLSAVQA